MPKEGWDGTYVPSSFNSSLTSSTLSKSLGWKRIGSANTAVALWYITQIFFGRPAIFRAYDVE